MNATNLKKSIKIFPCSSITSNLYIKWFTKQNKGIYIKFNRSVILEPGHHKIISVVEETNSN